MIPPSQLIDTGSFFDQKTKVSDAIACKRLSLDDAIQYVAEVLEQVDFRIEATKDDMGTDENARMVLHKILWQDYQGALINKNEIAHILELPQIQWLIQEGYVSPGDPGTVRTRRGIKEIASALATSDMPELREEYVARVFRQANGEPYSRTSIHQMLSTRNRK